MAGEDAKTLPSDADIAAFIDAVPDEGRRGDAHALMAIYQDVTGQQPALWGPSIIGFGQYHYRYETGREGIMCRAGFSPRKANMVLYMMSGYADPATADEMAAMLARLGKHKLGKSCLYLGRFKTIDLDVLREMIAYDWDWMNRKYP